MLSALTNGKIYKPKLIDRIEGLAPDRKPLSVFDAQNSLAEKELRALGIPFSLFTAVQTKAPLEEIGIVPTEIRRTLPMTQTARAKIFEGMDRVMWSPKGTARPSIIRQLLTNPGLQAEYMALSHQVIGKTSTAEILFRPNLNPSSPAYMTKYTWFAALSFSPEYPVKTRYDHPELSIVVFLRHGNVGRDGATLAMQMVKKWREIKKKHGLDSSAH